MQIPELMERVGKGQRLVAINGSPPQLNHLPQGSVFAPRCPMAQAICFNEVPQAKFLSSDHASACHFAEQVEHG